MNSCINKFTFLGKNIPIQDEEVRENVEQIKTRLTNVETLAGDTAGGLKNVNQDIKSIEGELSDVDDDISEIKTTISNIQTLSYTSSTETIIYS